MRTAEEILYDNLITERTVYFNAAKNAINEARKEAIEETGKKFFYKGFEKCKNDDANCFTAWREEAPNLILSLINELK